MWRRGPQVYPQVPQVGPVARRRAWGHGRLVRAKVIGLGSGSGSGLGLGLGIGLGLGSGLDGRVR